MQYLKHFGQLNLLSVILGSPFCPLRMKPGLLVKYSRFQFGVSRLKIKLALVKIKKPNVYLVMLQPE